MIIKKQVKESNRKTVTNDDVLYASIPGTVNAQLYTYGGILVINSIYVDDISAMFSFPGGLPVDVSLIYNFSSSSFANSYNVSNAVHSLVAGDPSMSMGFERGAESYSSKQAMWYAIKLPGIPANLTRTHYLKNRLIKTAVKKMEFEKDEGKGFENPDLDLIEELFLELRKIYANNTRETNTSEVKTLFGPNMNMIEVHSGFQSNLRLSNVMTKGGSNSLHAVEGMGHLMPIMKVATHLFGNGLYFPADLYENQDDSFKTTKPSKHTRTAYIFRRNLWKHTMKLPIIYSTYSDWRSKWASQGMWSSPYFDPTKIKEDVDIKDLICKTIIGIGKKDNGVYQDEPTMEYDAHHSRGVLSRIPRFNFCGRKYSASNYYHASRVESSKYSFYKPMLKRKRDMAMKLNSLNQAREGNVRESVYTFAKIIAEGALDEGAKANESFILSCISDIVASSVLVLLQRKFFWYSTLSNATTMLNIGDFAKTEILGPLLAFDSNVVGSRKIRQGDPLQTGKAFLSMSHPEQDAELKMLLGDSEVGFRKISEVVSNIVALYEEVSSDLGKILVSTPWENPYDKILDKVIFLVENGVYPDGEMANSYLWASIMPTRILNEVVKEMIHDLKE